MVDLCECMRQKCFSVSRAPQIFLAISSLPHKDSDMFLDNNIIAVPCQLLDMAQLQHHTKEAGYLVYHHHSSPQYQRCQPDYVLSEKEYRVSILLITIYSYENGQLPFL